MRAASVRMNFCRFLCMSWHLYVLAPRPTCASWWFGAHHMPPRQIGGKRWPQPDSVYSPRGLRGSGEARSTLSNISKIFSSHGACFISGMKPPTSRVVRRRQTWPSASRVRPGSAWSGWARWDRQRTMYARASPAAHPEPSKVEHFR